MIAGTPVLDIKPYIPEYDSPHTRMDSEPYDPNTDQPQTVSQDETTDILTDSETDDQSDSKRKRTNDDDLGSKSEADCPVTDSCRAQFPLHKDLHKVLEEVKAYVTQGDLYQLSCASQDQVSDSSKTKPSESTMDHPHYGEEAYSTIAGWIREPPVGSLEVRFTPQAERQLTEFLPAHLSGKTNLSYAL